MRFENGNWESGKFQATRKFIIKEAGGILKDNGSVDQVHIPMDELPEGAVLFDIKSVLP